MAHEAESYFKAALLHVFLCQLTQPQIMGPNLKHEAPHSTQFSQSEHCAHRVHGLMCGISKAEQVPGLVSVQTCLGLWTYIFSNALPVRLMYSSMCSLVVISGSRRQSGWTAICKPRCTVTEVSAILRSVCGCRLFSDFCLVEFFGEEVHFSRPEE